MSYKAIYIINYVIKISIIGEVVLELLTSYCGGLEPLVNMKLKKKNFLPQVNQVEP